MTDSPSCDSFPYSYDILGTLIAMLAAAYNLLLTIKVRFNLFLLLTEHQLVNPVPQVFEQAFAVAALLCHAFFLLQTHHCLLHFLASVFSLNRTISTSSHGRTRALLLT